MITYLMIITLNIFLISSAYVIGKYISSNKLYKVQMYELQMKERLAAKEEEENLPDSPYSLTRTKKSGSGDWGFGITKNGSLIMANGYSQWFFSCEEAVQVMNQLEQADKVKQTYVKC